MSNTITRPQRKSLPFTPGEFRECPQARRVIEAVNPAGHIRSSLVGYCHDRGNRDETAANVRLFIHSKSMHETLSAFRDAFDTVATVADGETYMALSPVYDRACDLLAIVDGTMPAPVVPDAPDHPELAPVATRARDFMQHMVTVLQSQNKVVSPDVLEILADLNFVLAGSSDEAACRYLEGDQG